MPVSEPRRRANAKYDREHCELLAAKVQREFGLRVREYAAARGESLSGLIKRALLETMERDGSGKEGSA